MNCFGQITFYLFGDAKLPLDVVAKVSEVFGIKAQIKGKLPLPDGYDPVRMQYRAEPFVKSLLLQKSRFEEVVVGVTKEDLYEDGLNFVFGVALPFRVAVVATARLDPVFYGIKENEKLFSLRTLKEIDHEIGHVLGLSHCPNPKCVMHFSNSLADTDFKSYDFCFRCRIKVDQMICRS